jgi:hypothetical protein
LKANKINLFVSSVLFVFWYHSPTVLDTPSYYKYFDNIKGTIYGNMLPSGTQVKKGWEPLM